MNRIDHVRVAFPAWLCQCLCFCGICREAEDGSGDGALPLMTLAVEFVGTFFFVLTAALSQEPFAIGAMLTSLVYALDHISADFNPAITVAMGVRRGALFSQRGKIISIVLAQMLGAFAAAEALGPGVAAAFTDSPQVRACAALPMRFVAASQPLNVLVFIGDGVAYGAGDFAFVSAAMLAAGGLAAAEMVATSASGLLGVWRGMTLLQAGRSAGLALRYWWAPAGGPLILRPPPPPREQELAPQRGAQPPGDGGGPPQ